MIDDLPHDEPTGPMLLCAGTDPSAAAHLAEVAASLLRDRPAIVLATWSPPPLTGLESLVDALYDTHEELREAARDAANHTAHAASDVLAARGIHVTRRICPEEQLPWQEILDVAAKFDAAVIVAGTTEDAAANPGTLGSQARALAHRAHRPLLFVPADARPPERDASAIFAYDGSPAAGRAVDLGAQLLLRRPALVTTVWHGAAVVASAAMVAVPDDVVRKGVAALDDAARLQAAGQAGEASQRLHDAEWSCEPEALESSRNAASAIVRAGDAHDAAVVVTGTRGRSRIAAALLGSTAESILRRAGRPVLLVPPASE